MDEYGEQRWHAIGAVRSRPGSQTVLLVVHAYREDRDGEEIVRIISARRAGPDDVRRYQKQEWTKAEKRSCPPSRGKQAAGEEFRR